MAAVRIAADRACICNDNLADHCCCAGRISRAAQLYLSYCNAVDFAANLVVYGPTADLPSGSPGDPVRDYNKQHKCGTFQKGQR